MGWGIPGLDKVFGLAGLWKSLRPSDFAQAFGRAVVAPRRRLRRGAEAPLYLKSNRKCKCNRNSNSKCNSNRKCKCNRNSKCNSNSNSKCNSKCNSNSNSKCNSNSKY